MRIHSFDILKFIVESDKSVTRLDIVEGLSKGHSVGVDSRLVALQELGLIKRDISKEINQARGYQLN